MASQVVLVGSQDKQLLDLLAASGLKVSCVDLESLILKRQLESPEVIVVDIRQSGIPTNLSSLRPSYPATGIIAVAVRLDPAMMLDAMRAGVNEFLTEPLNEAELRTALERVSALRPAPAERQVFAFIGAKGGVGTTTVAVNVATSLAQNKANRVLMLDLHPANGDAALFFGAEPRFSVLDALENTHRLDDAYLRGLVVRAKAGLDVLASSDRSVAGGIDAHRVRTLIEFVSRQYSHVIIDVPRSDPSALDALEGVTKIVIVCEQELSTVRGAARMASTLRQRYGKDRVQLVVSRFDAASAIGESDVARVTGGKIAQLFPSEYRLAVDALNRGVPLVVENNSKLAGALSGFARSLAGVPKVPEQKKSTKGGGLFGLLGR